MNWNASVTRKAIYVGVIALLLFPLFMLGQPAMRDPEKPRPGGILAQLRSKHGLSQAELGEIDPASESMKLATLGMKGIAANLLWIKADGYRKTENWDSLSATLNQISKLQPNYISIWEFQGHNLSYNISVEFDDYRTRYHWVTKGINYLIDGTEYNRDSARLQWSVAWFTGQKIGRADEKVGFRQLFRVDRDFHNRMRDYVDMDSREIMGPDQRPDNWLTSSLWYRRAEDIVLNTGRVPDAISLWYANEVKTYQGKSPLVFHSNVAMAPVNFAESIEDEGHFGQRVQEAWKTGAASWQAFGQREIPTSEGRTLRLNDLDRVSGELAKVTEQLENLVPGLRERIRLEKRSKLSEAEIEALDTHEDKRSLIHVADARSAEVKMIVYPLEMVIHAEMQPHRKEARAYAKEATDKQSLLSRIQRYRSTVNYDYWLTRCEVEQQDRAINARRLVFEAERAYDDSDLVKAKQLFESSFHEWAGLFRDYPSLISDVSAVDLFESTLRYEKALSQLDTVYPADFPLTKFVNDIRRDKGLVDIRLGQKPSNETVVPLAANPDEPRASDAEEVPPEPRPNPSPKQPPQQEEGANQPSRGTETEQQPSNEQPPAPQPATDR